MSTFFPNALGGIHLLAVGIVDFAFYPFVIGICALASAYFMGKSMYVICSGGMVKLQWGTRQERRWEDVAEIVDQKSK
jgi:hypothetical protein